ncbi:twin-arginine translocase subunit TatB [Neisseriaceae bacterium PsAf]|nr:twin-arginine translocase subunit TatB [Neisseriaceae bacterium PsAf]MCV2503468.1 Sec-independent protein translocase protein TatB [Neisseriaceae bacterium]
MFDLSFAEILVILIVALVVLGPEKLPKFARFIGNTINKVKGLGQQIQSTLVEQTEETEISEISQSIKDSVGDLTQQFKKDLSGLKDDLPNVQEKFLFGDPVPDDDHLDYIDRPNIKSSLSNKRRRSQRNKYKQQISFNKKPSSSKINRHLK